MGKCVYCGEKASLQRHFHKECHEKRESGTELLSAVTKGIVEQTAVPELERELTQMARQSFHDKASILEAVIVGWEQTVEKFLEDGHLDESEESRLATFASGFGLGQAQLDRKGAWMRLAKGGALRDLLNGRIPSRLKIEGDLPFNFQKSEQLIWVLPDTKYYEDQKRRQFVGRSSGASIRIAKGVYHRVGAFKGNPVDTVETVLMGTGLFGVTNKNLYLSGSGKGFRVRLDKVVAIHPYEDGVVIQQEQATARPKTLITGDGWFTYNVLKNATNVSS